MDVKNEGARAALFGKGDNGGGLISGVLIGGAGVKQPDGRVTGQNPLDNIEKVLTKLDVTHQQKSLHHNHFHIFMRAPTRTDIVSTNNLLAEGVAVEYTQMVVNEEQRIAAQAMLDDVQPQLNLNQGDINMLFMDVPPDVPAMYAPVVIAQASQAEEPAKAERTMGVCHLVNSLGGIAHRNPLSPIYVISPAETVRDYLGAFENKFFSYEKEIKVTMLQGPEHGELKVTASGNYRYTPVADYIGVDRATLMVEIGDLKVKAVYHFKVMDGGATGSAQGDPQNNKRNCPNGEMWKISTTSDPNGNLIVTSVDNQSLHTVAGSFATDAATLSYSVLDSLAVDPTAVTLNIADLEGGAVGRTTGSTITLDTNAANYNWYIDPTPGLNEEYLPTSNPNEWVAKEGTAAYGKMDMLSVLLHEYGHALGIEHSADNHDYMATTLTPGVRRMPSAEELALMQQLVGQLKGEMMASSPSWFDGLTTNGSGNTPSPIPLPLPLGGFGVAFLGRLRSSRYGDLSIVPDFATLTTQYAVAANATFANLDSPAGWNTQGSANIAPSGSGTSTGSVRTAASVTLNEVSTSQTRLSQVFMLGEQDRYLSFTLSGAALDDLNGAPDDAFEVALLDANTGLSVLGSNGLTRTDGFLNLQADGTQHLSECVTCTWNSDGTRTYRVDLSGVTRNTAVNLSFDLLGFGQDNSHVTLSDIRVSGLPQLHDDAASLPEDNLLTFDPFAQADPQLKPLLAAHIVDTPTHGAVTVNADGTFAYTPDLDYFGADSFSYRLSDGPLDSNLATVSLSVAPVNDAPVAADVALTTAEDTALVIALGVYASDVDSATLAAQIVTGPTYGVLTQNADGTYSYTPSANYNGADSFTYRVNDGALDSNIATVTLAFTSVNDAPQGMSATVTTLEDTDYVFQLSDFGYSDAMDAGSNAGANNFSAVTITTLPLVGTLTNNGVVVVSGQRISVADIALGLLKFAPAFNANGAGYASFTFQVQDDGNTANGGVDIDQTARTMNIDVTAVNDAPVAVDTQAATDEDTPLNLNLLAAASDVDGDVLTPVIIAGPLHGQLIQNADGTFNYVSELNYFGTDSFAYKVNDGHSAVEQGDSSIVTVSLTIAAVNDAPVAVSAAVTGPEDTPYIFSWSDFRVSDVDSVDLAITINTLPLDGLLQYYDGLIWLEVIAGQRIVKADIDAGFLCFGPDANESGFDGYSTTGTGNLMQDYASFTYQADDGSLSSAVASMTINITPVADTPSLVLTAPPVDAYGATAMLFSTSWESASNRSPTSTVLPQCELEGWHAITPAGDPNNHFIVWSSGDKMKDAKQPILQ